MVSNEKPETTEGIVHTVLVLGSCPATNLLQARLLPECPSLGCCVLEALLDLHAFILLDIDAKNPDILVRSVESLMASSILVKDVLSDNSPVLEVEGRVLENAVGVHQPIQDKSKMEYQCLSSRRFLAIHTYVSHLRSLGFLIRSCIWQGIRRNEPLYAWLEIVSMRRACFVKEVVKDLLDLLSVIGSIESDNHGVASPQETCVSLQKRRCLMSMEIA